MLGTLMKYELKSVGRVMLPIYGAFIAISLLFGLSMFIGEGRGEDSSFIASVVTSVTGIVYVLLAVAIFVFTIILIIQRFYKNLLGNEGYLCFTLPVSTNAHIANKLLSSVIWCACGVVIAGASAFILLSFFITPGEMFAGLDSVMQEILLHISGGELAKYAVELVVLTIFSCAMVTIKIYASIAAGQLWTNHRVLGAVAAYIVFGICESIVLNIMGAISSNTVNFTVNSAEELSGFFLLAIVIIAVFIAAYWAVTYVLLDRKLNLQ